MPNGRWRPAFAVQCGFTQFERAVRAKSNSVGGQTQTTSVTPNGPEIERFEAEGKDRR